MVALLILSLFQQNLQSRYLIPLSVQMLLPSLRPHQPTHCWLIEFHTPCCCTQPEKGREEEEEEEKKRKREKENHK